MLVDWISKALAPLRSRLVARAANRARDAGRYDAAARLYGEALKDDPSRTGVRVQRANMLKDSGRFEDAEAEYRRALEQRPSDADIHLQLGHLEKVRGNRTEALEHYRLAGRLDPDRGHAERELALAGDREGLELRFQAAVATGAEEGLLAMVAELSQIRERLERALERLPDLISQAAFPVAHYDTLRRLWDVPAPPDAPTPVSVVVVMDVMSHDQLNRTAAALSAQSLRAFQVALVGGETSRRQWAERLAAADGRFERVDADTNLGDVVRRMTHDVIVLPAPGATLHRHALAWFGWAAAHTEAAAFVCDEERRAGDGPEGRLEDAELRQAVDYEILLQANPFGDTLALVRSRCERALELAGGSETHAKLALLLELARRGAVGHIPYPLVAGVRAAAEPISRVDYAETVRCHLSGAAAPQTPTAGPSTLDIVIPTRDNAGDVQAFSASLRRFASHPDRVRLTVVDNGSTETRSLRVLAELAAKGVAVHRVDEPFNWSRLSNAGARLGQADIVVFANDDMLMLTRGWDQLLDDLLRRPEVGVVGAKLLYPDNTIQHAGILFGWRGQAIHDGLYEDRSAPGPGCRWQLRRRVAAVTGAFFAMRRNVFAELGGFDEQRLAVGYSDLDMSLKARRRGLAVLYAPEIELTHYESKSRGLTHLSEPTAAVDRQELAVLRARWPGELDKDVTAHPAWHAATLPFRLLSWPNRAKVIDRLICSAQADPWQPAPPQDGD